MPTGLLIITPPLKDFWTPKFSKVFYYLQKIWQFFCQVFIIHKKNRLRRAFIIYKISEAQIWALRGSIFSQKCCFCLKIPQKNFRLRRAGETLLLLVPKNFRLRRAFIINKIPKSICFYYLHKILQSFFLALIIYTLRGRGGIINSPAIWDSV